MVNIILDNWVRVSGLPRDIFHKIRERLTYPNPDYEKAKIFSKSGKVKFIDKTLISYYYENNEFLLPKGYFMEFLSLIYDLKLPYQIIDKRNLEQKIVLPQQVEARSYQEIMINDAMNYPGPAYLLQAAPGAGKTVTGMELVRRCGRKALWIAHTSPLVKQAIDNAKWVLGIPEKEIGIIGQSKLKVGEFFTVATVQTLNSKNKQKEIEALRYEFGTVVIDEIHHASARTWHSGAHLFAPAITVGLTATAYRNDGLTQKMFDCTGPIVSVADKDLLRRENIIVIPSVIMVNSGLSFSGNNFSEIITKIGNDYRRNYQLLGIIQDIHNQNPENVIILLSARVDHVEEMTKLCASANMEPLKLLGDLKRVERSLAFERLRAKEPRVILATYKLLSEGFDHPPISHIIFGTPFKDSVLLEQCIGRVQRVYPGKINSFVIDMTDSNAMLLRQARIRQMIYKGLGLHVYNYRKDIFSNDI